MKKSIVVNLIGIGEETGELDSLLMTVSLGLERKRSIRGKIMGALLYPLFVLIVSMVAAGIAIFVLIPALEKLITAMGKDLHPVTVLLLDISVAVQQYSIPCLLVLVMFITFLVIAYMNEKGRLFLDRTTLRLPLIGAMFRVYYSAEF